jgi:hypothetical protein
MKKYLPIILFLVGLLVLGGVFLLVRSKKSMDSDSDEETNLIEVPLEKRPVASLTPSEDGHWLKLKIEKLEIDAKSLDYELLYNFPDTETGESKTAGVPGTIALEGIDKIERDLLMGSESSGKFRYDEGVTGGTLTLRFRNEKGKLLVKFVSDFNLLSDTKELSSPDGKFTYLLDEEPKGIYFIIMDTFGVGDILRALARSETYAVFASKDVRLKGKMK